MSLRGELARLKAALPQPSPQEEMRQRFERLRRLPPAELQRHHAEAMASAPPSRWAGRLEKLPADELVRLYLWTLSMDPRESRAAVEATLVEYGL